MAKQIGPIQKRTYRISHLRVQKQVWKVVQSLLTTILETFPIKISTGATVSILNSATFAQPLPWSKHTTQLVHISNNSWISPIPQPLTVILEPLETFLHALQHTCKFNRERCTYRIVLLEAHQMDYFLRFQRSFIFISNCVCSEYTFALSIIFDTYAR